MKSERPEIIDMQANEHPLEYGDEFMSLEAYCLHLMHRRAYEEAAQIARGLTVLDLGCNNGFGTHHLSSVAASVVGLDVSEAAIADARRRFADCDFRVFAGVNLPFPEAAFDVVVSLQVIEHIADTAVYLGEIKRVLKPSGTAVFTTPNAAIRLDPGMRPWNRFHVREYRAEELRQSLAQVFDSVTVRGLFANEVLYQVEYRRCQASLAAARRALGVSTAAPLPMASETADWKRPFIGFLKTVLPTTAIAVLRNLQHHWLGGAGDEPLGPEDRARYSTASFFYRDAELDRALDLIAICRRH